MIISGVNLYVSMLANDLVHMELDCSPERGRV